MRGRTIADFGVVQPHFIGMAEISLIKLGSLPKVIVKLSRASRMCGLQARVPARAIIPPWRWRRLYCRFLLHDCVVRVSM